MKKKLSIYTFVDKNPEFLQLQIDSFNKHMATSSCEFIVVNASIQYNDEMSKICEANNIKIVNYPQIRKHSPNYYVEQLNWFRDAIQASSSDFILLIHSDMFFINSLDFEKFMNNKKIYINPQYRDTPFYKVKNGNFDYFYIWDGVILFDSEYLNMMNLTQYFDWSYIQGITDVGGRTNELLKIINIDDVGYIEFWTHHKTDENILQSGLNGGIIFTIDMGTDEKKILEGIQMGNRSYPYENENENYDEYVIEKVTKIKQNFVDPYFMTNNVQSDFIQFKDEPIESSFILHFKSGSQLVNKNQYEKLESIRKIIFRNEI